MTLPQICCIRSSPEFPEHSEYLMVFPDSHRIVCAVLVATTPIRHAPMSMSYIDVEPGHIRTQLRPECAWQDDYYRIEQDKVFWSHRVPSNEQHPWKLIPHEDLPDWFEAFQTKAQKRMDERWAALTSREAKDDEGLSPRESQAFKKSS